MVVALEIVLPDSGQVEIGDTLQPRARALNSDGDSVQADISWTSLKIGADTLAITLLDSTTGRTFAKAVGNGHLQARTGPIISNPQTVIVLAKLDSARTVGATRDTVTLVPDTAGRVDSLSDSLRVQLYATGSPAAGRLVVYAATTFPASGPSVTFAPNDSIRSDLNGLAVARLRLQAGTRPDSVIVTATVRRFDNTDIDGSPLTFVVVYGGP